MSRAQQTFEALKVYVQVERQEYLGIYVQVLQLLETGTETCELLYNFHTHTLFFTKTEPGSRSRPLFTPFPTRRDLKI
jgi:hypothetical protein